MSGRTKQTLEKAIELLLEESKWHSDILEKGDKVYADECRHMAKQIDSLLKAYAE